MSWFFSKKNKVKKTPVQIAVTSKETPPKYEQKEQNTTPYFPENFSKEKIEGGKPEYVLSKLFMEIIKEQIDKNTDKKELKVIIPIPDGFDSKVMSNVVQELNKLFGPIEYKSKDGHISDGQKYSFAHINGIGGVVEISFYIHPEKN